MDYVRTSYLTSDRLPALKPYLIRKWRQEPKVSLKLTPFRQLDTEITSGNHGRLSGSVNILSIITQGQVSRIYGDLSCWARPWMVKFSTLYMCPTAQIFWGQKKKCYWLQKPEKSELFQLARFWASCHICELLFATIPTKENDL